MKLGQTYARVDITLRSSFIFRSQSCEVIFIAREKTVFQKM